MKTFGSCTFAYWHDGDKLVPVIVCGVWNECAGMDRDGGADDLSAQLQAPYKGMPAERSIHGSARDFIPRSMVTKREGGGVLIDRAYRWVKGI